MSLTFKMFLPVIIVSVITIISMIILCRRSLICNCLFDNTLKK